ncbi:MAG: AsmA family protein [Nitrospirota bacterium]
MQGVKKSAKVLFAAFLIALLFLLFFAYFHYRNLKDILISKLSEKSTALIGQPVEIRDLSFGLTEGISFYDILIRNPEDFDSGNLVRLKKINLNPHFFELLKGRLVFKKIALYSPELSLMTNREGRWNISEKLLQFLTRPRPPEFEYKIREISIASGAVIYGQKQLYSSSDINVKLKNLSSDPDMKTLIQGSFAYGENKIRINGWTYLGRRPKEISLSLSSKGFTLSHFAQFLPDNRHLKDAKIDISVHVNGDTERGFEIKSDAKARNTRLFSDVRKELHMTVQAFLDIYLNSIPIENITLYAEENALIRGSAIISDLRKRPAYRGEFRIDRLDLSGMRYTKNKGVKGVVTSDNLRAWGYFEKAVPDVSGRLKIRRGMLNSDRIVLADINGDVELNGKREPVKARADAKIIKAGEYSLSEPANAKVLLIAHARPERISIRSSVNVSPIIVRIKNRGGVALNSLLLTSEGSLKGEAFSGKNSLKIRGIRYGSYEIREVNSAFDLDYRPGFVVIKNQKADIDGMHISSTAIEVDLSPRKAKISEIAVTNLEGYFQRKIALRNFDLRFYLEKKERLSGKFVFSGEEATAFDVVMSRISGDGNVDERGFSIDVAESRFAGGTMRAKLRGTSGKIFPAKVHLIAENLDIGSLSKAVSSRYRIPYSFSGILETAKFEGRIISSDSFDGNASLQAGLLSVLITAKKRHLLKKAGLGGVITFEGDDIFFKAEVTSGNVFAEVSGEIERFIHKDRIFKADIKLPDVGLISLRESLWDVFPDSLLYAGLEGSLSSSVSIEYNEKGLKKAIGYIKLKEITVEGENGEYFLGPISGNVPIEFDRSTKRMDISIASFEKSQFKDLSRYYSDTVPRQDFSRITMGSFGYGFRLLKDIKIFVKQNGRLLNIDYFNANIFAGKISGSGFVDFSKGLNYKAGFILEGMSLKKLCEEIEPIKGYISGKVNGIGLVRGSGTGISELTGRADFWTYSINDEETEIGKKFLQKVGGPSLKAYLRDRPYDRGVLGVYLSEGYLIFKELEISNRNIFGIRDLSITVAPVSNRIAIADLMWTITEAAYRAAKEE